MAMPQEAVDQAEAYYFHHYMCHFSDNAQGAAYRSIPSVMSWDDHDIFDVRCRLYLGWMLDLACCLSQRPPMCAACIFLCWQLRVLCLACCQPPSRASACLVSCCCVADLLLPCPVGRRALAPTLWTSRTRA
jgi:hypothetical protein